MMIALEGITKIYQTEGHTKTVLNNISLKLPANESVALIGRNGAGKSSLLKIVAGLIRPTSGVVRTSCRISWPIGFAGSFHAELTGAQNAKFVARVYGVPSDRVIASVAEFAELGPEFYNPVRTYSSGMRARLAFAVSMAIDFDFYLIDEVTSVGDANFRKKSVETLLNKIGDCGALVVSHNIGILRQLCSRAIVIEGAEAYVFDKVNSAIAFYNWSRENVFSVRNIGKFSDTDGDLYDFDPTEGIGEAGHKATSDGRLRDFFKHKDGGVAGLSGPAPELDNALAAYRAAPSGERAGAAEIVAVLAQEVRNWPYVFAGCSTEVAQATLALMMDAEQWAKAEQFVYFLFSERIDGAATALRSLCMKFVCIREGLAQGEKRPGGRWLTLARAAARAHDAGAEEHAYLAGRLMTLKQPFVKEARYHVEQALAIDPDDVAALCVSARIHLADGNHEEALLIAFRAMELAPGDEDVLGLRDEILENRSTEGVQPN